jgi:O-antigen/teichoic acid export membrane protein
MGLFLSVYISFFFFQRLKLMGNLRPIIRTDIIRRMVPFSIGSYIAENLRQLPQWILPLEVVYILGPKIGAFFGIAWIILGMLLSIPQMAGYVLINRVVTSSESVRVLFVRVIKFITVFSILGIIFVVFVGKPFLNILGSEYAQNGYNLLVIFSISTIPYSINTLYITIDRIQKNTISTIIIYLFILIFTIGGSYWAMNNFGIEGIGFAWLVANLLVSIIIIIKILRKTKRISADVILQN